jgi:hypothetical protein
MPELLGLDAAGLLSEQSLTDPDPSWPSWAEFGRLVTLVFGVLTLTFS